MEEKFFEFKSLWADRDTREAAKAKAQEIYDEFPVYFRRYEGCTREEMVDFVSTFRARGNIVGAIGADIWLLVNHEPQHIGGEGNYVVKAGA